MRCPLSIASLAVVGLVPIVASAQCPPIDFEDYAPGTVITTQYSGVTFSAQPNACGTVDMVIGIPPAGTSSGAQALVIEQGCFEFSEEFLRMVFDADQAVVEFSLGEPLTPGVTFHVRSYRSNGTLITTQVVTAGTGVTRNVMVGSPGSAAIIRRIEIEQPVGAWEAIDDLRFLSDTTPPLVEIDAPAFLSCVCDTVPITGYTDDPEGYYYDELHYRRVNAAPGDPWVFVNRVFAPFPAPGGTLYTWDATGLPHGSYFLRVTARNDCGLEASDITAVYLDRLAPVITLDSPADTDTVCGVVEFRGSVIDGCTGCMETWRVEYMPQGGQNWITINSGNANEHCQLGLWDTTTGNVPDGPYLVQIYAEDACGNSASLLISVIVDNTTGACDCPGDVNGDGEVNVTDLLILLGAWGPCFGP